MDRIYWRAVPQNAFERSAQSLRLAGGWLWFDRVEKLQRGKPPELLPVTEVPPATLSAMTAQRLAVGGLDLSEPRVMGILNTTPDSFSDGGEFTDPAVSLARATALAQSCDMIDIGGESTRPGAREVPVSEEIARTAPVIAALRAAGLRIPVSVDTRKAAVAAATLKAGADLINDVSAMEFDAGMHDFLTRAAAPVCLMHMRGTPETMNDATAYNDVLLDVYDYLEQRRDIAEAAGIPRARILLDPGIGFAKTHLQNITLTARLSLYHSLGCGILYGASRKRFVGTIGGAAEPKDRLPGSLAVALAAVSQGAQVIRVHDAAQTTQALRLWQALNRGGAA